jgi:hypothetical protein
MKNLATVSYVGHGNVFSLIVARRYCIRNKRKLASAYEVMKQQVRR